MKTLIITLFLVLFSSALLAETIVYEPLEQRGDVYYTTPTYNTPYYFSIKGVDRTCYTTERTGVTAAVGPLSISSGGNTYKVYCY